MVKQTIFMKDSHHCASLKYKHPIITILRNGIYFNLTFKYTRKMIQKWILKPSHIFFEGAKTTEDVLFTLKQMMV